MIKRANVNLNKNVIKKYAFDPSVLGAYAGALTAPSILGTTGAGIGAIYSILRKKSEEEKKHKIKTLIKDAIIGGGIGGGLGLGLGAAGGALVGMGVPVTDSRWGNFEQNLQDIGKNVGKASKRSANTILGLFK